MNERLKQTGFLVVSIAMLMLLMHTIIPHHHHHHNSYTECCSDTDESLDIIHCSLDSEQSTDQDHPCFQCNMEQEWQVNSSNFLDSSALLPEHVILFYTKSEQPSRYEYTISIQTPDIIGVQYRGPPHA